MSHFIQKRFTGKPTRPKLSPDFGLKLIEKEVELDKNCSVDVIQDLVQIYTEAIEFYSYMKDKKSLDFQDRMHKMFMRPDVIKAMRLNTPASPVKSVTMQQRRVESEQKKLEQATIAKDLMQTQSEKTFNRVVEYQKLRNIEVARRAVMDFKSQDRDLQKRLDSRKKSMLTKSMESIRYLNTSTNPDAGLIAVGEEIEYENNSFCKYIIEEDNEPDIEEDLEEIMDRYCTEKAKKVAEVQLKYEVQMGGMEGEGSIFEQIRTQMKKDMQNELFDVTSQIEKEKNEEIFRLKSRHKRNSISLS